MIWRKCSTKWTNQIVDSTKHIIVLFLAIWNRLFHHHIILKFSRCFLLFSFDSVSCCICCSHLHWFPALLSCPGNSPLLDKSLYYWQHQERPPVWTTFNYTNDCEFFSSPFSFAFFILNLKRKWSSHDLNLMFLGYDTARDIFTIINKVRRFFICRN